MKKQTQPAKKIRNLDDLKKLELGDKVEIYGYGKAVYYATSMNSHTFVGRIDNEQIYELEVARGHLTPTRDGCLGLGKILREEIFHYDPAKISLYGTKRDLLRAEGII